MAYVSLGNVMGRSTRTEDGGTWSDEGEDPDPDTDTAQQWQSGMGERLQVGRWSQSRRQVIASRCFGEYV